MTCSTFIRVYVAINQAKLWFLCKNAYLQVLDESFEESNEVFSTSDISRNSFAQKIIR